MLSFRTATGDKIYFVTRGDCCNAVWVNHISGVDIIAGETPFDLLRGAVVTAVEDKGWTGDREDVEGHEYVSDGFYTITTDRGYIDIEIRNSHNGYYGGSVDYLDPEDLDRYQTVEYKLYRISEDF